ncbi:hypothetical protein AACM93_000563 [Escherichia coli]
MITEKLENAIALANTKVENQLDQYITFGNVHDVDPQNIPAINEILKAMNFKNEKDGEPLVDYISMSIYENWLKAQAKKEKAKTQNKNGKQAKAETKEPKPTAEPKKDTPTELEPIFARQMYANENFASIARDEECFMYEWLNNYWKRLSKVDGQRTALAWLEKNYPEKATAKNALGCYDTARIGLLNKRHFPARKQDELFIPLRNKWLLMNNQGEIKIVEPSRKVGITHQINATLKMPTKSITDDQGNTHIVEQSANTCTDDFGNTSNLSYQPKPLPETSLFKKFLDTSMPNKITQDLLQEYVGYTLLPDTRYQKALVCVGKGSNGKGVFFEVVSHLHENVASVVLEKLNDFGLSQIPDASLVCVAETPKKGINEEMLKQLISGDKVVIDIKKKNQFTYKPFAKWLISCNAFPRIQDETDGVWRRLIIVHWDKQFLESEKINNLEKKIVSDEMGLVLDWALIGLQRLLARGDNGDFIIPEHLKAIKEKEKEKSNNVIPFIDNTYLVQSTTATTKKDDIFKRYQAYCIDKGIMPYGVVEFWKRVGYYYKDGLKEERKRDGGERKLFINLVFKPDMDEDECDNPYETN